MSKQGGQPLGRRRVSEEVFGGGRGSLEEEGGSEGSKNGGFIAFGDGEVVGMVEGVKKSEPGKD